MKLSPAAAGGRDSVSTKRMGIPCQRRSHAQPQDLYFARLDPGSGGYTIANRELVAEGADLRVQVLSLAAGQCVPWHYHSEISDSFVCLEGPMVVETRAPLQVYRFYAGGS